MIKQTLAALILLSGAAAADPAQINSVSVTKQGDAFTFNVTVAHGDTGWEHYVDVWRIKDLDGTVLGERQLAHPHVDEQPFTRSLSGVSIPASIDTVVIEAHDTITGWSADIEQVKVR